jgi:pilus assembly protein CpaB
MQNRNWVLLAIAVAVGLLAVFIANSWFSGREEQQAQAGRQQQLVRVVVASQPLEFGTRLTSQNVRLQDWPAGSLPQGAFRTVPDALRNNRVALKPIVPGEPVLATNVSGADGRALLASVVPPGMRAVSIAVDPVSGVSGFVLPGTLVDVLLTRKIPGEGASSEDLRSDVMLENVQVLAVDQLADEKSGEPKVARTATIAVTLRDAQRLAIAEKVGSLRLVLRKIEDAAGTAPIGERPAMMPVTNRNLGGPDFSIGARRAAGVVPLAPAQAAGASGAVVVVPPLPTIGGGTSNTGAPASASGPTMTVFRGTLPTSYPVSKKGGR